MSARRPPTLLEQITIWVLMVAWLAIIPIYELLIGTGVGGRGRTWYYPGGAMFVAGMVPGAVYSIILWRRGVRRSDWKGGSYEFWRMVRWVAIPCLTAPMVVLAIGLAGGGPAVQTVAAGATVLVVHFSSGRFTSEFGG